MEYTITEERLSAGQYIEFLKHTDLGSQYPKERFEERIATLVRKASISLVARDAGGRIIGVCFGITDFAYWLFITDLGVVRDCTGMGIGISEQRIVFTGGENPTTVIYPNAMETTRLTVQNTLTLGTFALIPGTSGNLSLRFVGS